MKTRVFGVLLAAVALVGAGGGLACSGSKPPAKTESEWSSTSADPVGEGEEADHDGGEEPAGDASGTPSDEPKPIGSADDYDITRRDCDALATAYHNAWLADEMPKLADKKLAQKQYDQAVAQLHEAAGEARDQWLGQCEGIVGTAFLHSRLACAMKAKTLARFDDCWDGKVQD